MYWGVEHGAIAAAVLLDLVVGTLCKQRVAGCVNQALRCKSLPTVSGVHVVAKFSAQLSAVRRCIRTAILHSSHCHAAQAWLISHIRVREGRRKTRLDFVDASKASAQVQRCEYDEVSARRKRHALSGAGMRRVLKRWDVELRPEAGAMVHEARMLAFQHTEGIVADAGQFFESVTSSDADQAFLYVIRRAVAANSPMQVTVFRSARRHAYMGGSTGNPCIGQATFDFLELAMCIAAYVQLNLASVGDAVAQFSGVPIGGHLSKAVCSLIQAETEWSENEAYLARNHFLPPGMSWQRVCAAKRYVDDVLLVSALLCSTCLHDALEGIYPVKFDIACQGTELVWLDLIMSLCNLDIDLRPKLSRRRLPGHLQSVPRAATYCPTLQDGNKLALRRPNSFTTAPVSW
eukprot:s689_g44.t1